MKLPEILIEVERMRRHLSSQHYCGTQGNSMRDPGVFAEATPGRDARDE
jgi:hypothetical protein